MIPKIIHYCWFGRGEKPKLALKCIESWKRFLPDYEIKEWNEDNFDVNIVPYTAEAYSAKKYAFVSDYARFWILYHEGGLYFDTDVEVIKPMGDIVDRGGFMGIEVDGKSGNFPWIAPGLGLGVEAGNEIYKAIIDYYAAQRYLDADGTPSNTTVVKHATKVLMSHGLKPTNGLQQVGSLWIYPKDYFNPLDNNTGRLKITDHTVSIHWYAKSWILNKKPLRDQVVRLIHRYFGNESLGWLKQLLDKH